MDSDWIIYNGKTGAVVPMDAFPFEVGAHSTADMKIDATPEREVQFTMFDGGQDIALFNNGANSVFINGKAHHSGEYVFEENVDYLVLAGRTPLAIRGGRGLGDWIGTLNPNRWTIYDATSGQTHGPYAFSDMMDNAQGQVFPADYIVLLEGMETGARIGQLLESSNIKLIEKSAPAQTAGTSASNNIEPTHVEIAHDQGALICPVCWLHFDAEDIMHVATHPELKGDSILGQDAATRFHASRFDELNRALDPKGSPCTEFACPHCRRELPPDFIAAEAHIISIVGDAAAGKSYYLATLSKLLPELLFREMGVVFQDANPAGNAKINNLKNTLFGAKKPEEAVLAKTELEGDMYERCTRYEREVQMPSPFVYSISKGEDADRSLITLYDNAGEHFRPGIDINDRPGAQHVSNAAGIIFIFDPFSSVEFLKIMKDGPDPQKNHYRDDYHDVILAEMKVRIQKLQNLPSGKKTETPLAIVIGKSDGWKHALPAPLREDFIVDGKLNLSALSVNHDMIREFLMKYDPKVVANAEAFSSCIKYFAASSFGHAPTDVQTAQGFVPAPDPEKLRPQMVEIPPLWILSQAVPYLITAFTPDPN